MSKSQAAKILLAREEARTSLIKFTEYTLDTYETAAHHRVIAEKLEAVIAGKIKRLMIFMPPRHGKSELASIHFPAFYIGQRPKDQIIAASYGGDLATDFGREVRNLVASQDYQNIYPEVQLRADSKAANRWRTNEGGVYVAAGVCGSITGKGAHILIIDDPIKDRKEADSETTRANVWNWYSSTAYTRLMPGGAVILIQTRWHDDDLAGRLLEKQKEGGDQWEIIDMPAIKGKVEEDGRDNRRALWPAWYSVRALDAIKGVVTPRDWNSLYMQNPVPDDGDFFKRKWFQWYKKEQKPKHLRIYGASDYAVTEDGGDWTVHIVIGLDPDHNIYVLDLWRKKASSKEWVDSLLDLAENYEPVEWAEEAGQIEKGVGPFIVSEMERRKIFFSRRPFASSTDKPTRAQAIRGICEFGKVYFPLDEPWTDALVNEMLRFPAGVNDDQVDTMSLIGRMLGKMFKAHVPKREEAKPAKMTYSYIIESTEEDDTKSPYRF